MDEERTTTLMVRDEGNISPKQIYKKLRESEEIFRKLFEEAIDAIFIADAETGIIIDCNLAASNLVGREKSELIGKHQRILHPPSEIEGEFSRTYKRHLIKEGHILESKVITKNGEIRDVSIKANILEIKGRRILQGIFRDVTERKRVEDALRQSKENFESLAENAFDGLLVGTQEGVHAYANKRAAEITGYTVAGLLRTTIKDLVHPDESEKMLERYRRRIEGRAVPNPCETVIIAKDGRSVPIELSGARTIWQRNPADLVFFRDITDRKKADEALRESEEKMRNIFAASPDAVTVTNLKGNIVECNQATLSLHGYSSEEELIGKSAFELIAKKDHQRAMENLSKSLEKGEMKNLEYTFVTRDGLEFPAELSVGVIRDSSGIPTGFVAITKDITERKRVEDALRKSESKYRTLLENVPQKIFSKDRDLVYVSCNGNYARDLGIRPNEIAGKTDYDFYPRELAEKYRADDKRVLESGKVEDIEEEYVQNGQKVFVQTVKTPVKDENGNVVGVIGIFWDITEHRLMEQKYSTIVKTALDGFWINDSKGRLIAVNDAYCEMIGYTREELLSMSIRDIEASEKPEETAEHVKEIMKEGSDRFETRQRRKDGTVIDVEVSTTYYPAGKGQLVAFLRDVTDRKRMEDALAYERDLLYALMDNIPDSIYYKDTASRFTRINKALADLLGIKNTEEALGKTDFDFFTEEHARDAYSDEQKIMETRRPLINKIEKSERPDGYFLWSSTTKVPIKDKKDQITGIVGISRDITERKNMEAQLKEYSEQLEKKVEERTSQLEDAQEQLLKAARMATIGEVTAMVGHDLRNPLQVVVNTLYIAKKRTASLPPAEKESLTELHKTIAEQLTYMNKIVSDLQDYARPIVPQLVSTSLPQLITSTLSTLTVPDNVKVSILIPEDFPEMMFDPDLMRRVFTNLITNALQAMPEGGQLTINTCFDNEAMFISVEDTGVGIPKENLDKMFKPLFTTKSKGQGFGLPVCKRIVEAHGGSIMLESQVGKGSTFTVKMPKREVR